MLFGAKAPEEPALESLPKQKLVLITTQASTITMKSLTNQKKISEHEPAVHLFLKEPNQLESYISVRFLGPPQRFLDRVTQSERKSKGTSDPPAQAKPATFGPCLQSAHPFP